MKVYLVWGKMDYEGSEILGVYDTWEAAEKHRQNCETLTLRWNRKIEKWEAAHADHECVDACYANYPDRPKGLSGWDEFLVTTETVRSSQRTASQKFEELP